MPDRPKPPGMVFKRHNIRIWCHECDMARLQRVVWEGHGSKLLTEVSNQPAVKRFLEAVPYMMNTIKEIHNAVIQNDLEGLMKHSGEPVVAAILSSRDGNNMTVFHKAAGLGHTGILKYIAHRYPQGINDVDNEGRTPLHYAAIVRDEQHTYNTLVSMGADESSVDNKNRTPGYYANRPQEIDKSLLYKLPDAPRTPSSTYPSSWDWNILDSEAIVELNKKSRRKFKSSSENIPSKNNTTTISESTRNRGTGRMKTSSTHEFIKGLPELDDNRCGNIIHQESEAVIQEEEKGRASTMHSSKEITSNNLQENEETVDDESEKKNETLNEIVNETLEQYSNEDVLKDAQEDKKVINNEEKVTNTNEEAKTNQNKEVSQANLNKSYENEGEEKDSDNHNGFDKQNIEKTTQSIENHTENVEDEGNKKEQVSFNSHHDSEVVEPNENNEAEPEINLNEDVNNQNTDDDNDHTKQNESENTVEYQSEDTSYTMNNDLGDEKDSVAEGKKKNIEDDDDVQVQCDSQSEYSDTNRRSTAEAHSGSAKRGNERRSTQDSLIEGIVSGDAEQEQQDASVLEKDVTENGESVENEIDPEVAVLINTANMEMLAALVLNGEGSRLVGRRSTNSELQAFLDNVPTYMQKINKVHLAAREGNIRDLQAALDRRKFAIARDPISPNGATPLHVATVFGKTNIIKYLGGRFPETLSAVDFEGRTALHYAAALPDNGHYFNLLQQLGANSKDLDDNGKSTEDYLKNPNLLPYNQLLSDFGISEDEAQKMLSDKVPEDRVSSRRKLEAPEAVDTLERCYHLLASARSTRTPLSASSNKTTPPVVLGRFLKRPVFDVIKNRVTRLDHDLFDVIWPAVRKLSDNRNIVQTVEEDFSGGITAPDYYIFDVFHEFLLPLIKDLHNINVHAELPIHPPSDFLKQIESASTTSSEPLVELNIDPDNDYVLSGHIECSRNVEGFELPLNLKIGKLEAIERIITTLVMQENFTKLIEQQNPESDQKGGSYYTLNEVLEKPSEICAALASSGLLVALCERDEIDDSARLHGKHWPYGRGVFVSEDRTVAVWINIHDHLRVLISTPTDAPGEIGLPFSKLTSIMTYLHERLDFIWHPRFGHLSSRPTYLGAGIRFSLIANFPGLSKDPDNIKHLCAMRGLQYRETLSPNIARVSNYQCLNTTETNCFHDFTTAISNLFRLERDFSMQDSAHFANMLSNIFKRKRSIIAEVDSIDKQQYKD